MAKNKHKQSLLNDVNNRPCPKSKCHGKLIHCTVTYKPGGPIHNELECFDCGLIKKDPRYKSILRNTFQPRKQRPTRND